MTAKRVIYFGFATEFRLRIVDNLHERYGWEPVLICGPHIENLKNPANRNHADCVLVDSVKLRMADFECEGIGKPIPLDAEIIHSLDQYNLNALGFQEDTTGWNYSFHERKKYYYDMLKFWNTCIRNLNPDLVVFFTWPHTPTCYPLYLLSKHHFGMDILFLDPVPLFKKNFHLVGKSLENLSEPFMHIYESEDAFQPGDDVREALAELRGKQAKIPEYIKNVYRQGATIRRRILVTFAKVMVKTLLHGTGFRKDYSWKTNQKPYDLPASRMNHFEHILFMLRMRRGSIKLKHIYNSYCTAPDLASKYLYFASSYQPEAVTAINAGVYDELFLALDILSDVIPDDWVIYYKEHPAIFGEGFRGAQGRSKHFYEKLASYPNIQMIPYHSDGFELIDRSQAVATVTGTTAWEAAVRGKPAMSFGNAWYQGCRSIFSIYSLQDAKDAISEILHGYKPDQSDINRYAAALEQVAVKGLMHHGFNDKIEACENPTKEIEKIAEALHLAFDREVVK